MEYLCQTYISSKWGSLFLRLIGNFGLVTFTWLLEVAFIVFLMFQYRVCFLNVYKHTKTKKHPCWFRMKSTYLVGVQSMSGAKTRYLELSMSGEAYVIPLSNTFQLQPLATPGLHKWKVTSVDSINVHCLQQYLSNPMNTHKVSLNSTFS